MASSAVIVLFTFFFVANFVHLSALSFYFTPKLWYLHKVKRSLMVTKRRPKFLIGLNILFIIYFLIIRPLDMIPLLVENPPDYATSPRFSIPFRALGTLLMELLLVKLSLDVAPRHRTFHTTSLSLSLSLSLSRCHVRTRPFFLYTKTERG